MQLCCTQGPFFFSHACMACLTSCLRLKSVHVETVEWTRTDACATVKSKGKELERFTSIFALARTLPQHRMRARCLVPGNTSSAPQWSWKTAPIFFCPTAKIQRGKSEITSVLGITRVVAGHLSPTKPRGPWLKADEHSDFSLASDRAQFYNTLPATTRFCLSLAPARFGY